MLKLLWGRYTKVKALSTNSGRDKFLEEEISQLTDDELKKLIFLNQKFHQN